MLFVLVALLTGFRMLLRGAAPCGSGSLLRSFRSAFLLMLTTHLLVAALLAGLGLLRRTATIFFIVSHDFLHRVSLSLPFSTRDKGVCSREAKSFQLRDFFCGKPFAANVALPSFAGDHTRVGTCHAIIVGRDFVLASWPLASFSGLLLAWAGALSGMNSSSANARSG
jgi:hypothetical protein